MDRYIQENHTMIFERALAVDVDELYCPECGRRVVIQWSPVFQNIVLCEGNQSAMHTASQDDRTLGSAQIFVTPQKAALPEGDPERLVEWEGWLQEIDFEDLWR